MVPVLLHHAHGTVYVRPLPALLIVQPLVLLDPFKSMGFQIRLVNDIKSILVTEPVKIWHLRIMGTPYRIDVITLHHTQMLFHGFLANYRASVRTEIMHIDPVDQDRHTIYKEIRTSDLHSSKACNNLCFIHHIRRTFPAVQLKPYPVKRRYLRTPRADISHIRPNPGASLIQRLRPLGNLCSVSIRKHPLCPVRFLRRGNPLGQDSLPVVVRKPCLHGIILNPGLRSCNQCHISVDTAVPPHILTFQIGSVGPPVHSDRNLILAGTDKLCDVKFRR